MNFEETVYDITLRVICENEVHICSNDLGLEWYTTIVLFRDPDKIYTGTSDSDLYIKIVDEDGAHRYPLDKDSIFDSMQTCIIQYYMYEKHVVEFVSVNSITKKVG